MEKQQKNWTTCTFLQENAWQDRQWTLPHSMLRKTSLHLLTVKSSVQVEYEKSDSWFKCVCQSNDSDYVVPTAIRSALGIWSQICSTTQLKVNRISWWRQGARWLSVKLLSNSLPVWIFILMHPLIDLNSSPMMSGVVGFSLLFFSVTPLARGSVVSRHYTYIFNPYTWQEAQSYCRWAMLFLDARTE